MGVSKSAIRSAINSLALLRHVFFPKASAIGDCSALTKLSLPGSQTELAAESAERIFGAELEGLSGEDQEFETARLFVRFALEAARAAARAPPRAQPRRRRCRRRADCRAPLRTRPGRHRQTFLSRLSIASGRSPHLRMTPTEEITMHDIDRTQLEYSQEAGPFQQEEFEFQEFESGTMAGEMSEQEEIQLAHELLAVNNEQELEQFLGSFIKTRREHRRPDRQVAHRPGDRGRAQERCKEGPADGRCGARRLHRRTARRENRQRTGQRRRQSDRARAGIRRERGMEFAGARQFVRLAANTARQAAAAAAAGADPRLAAQSCRACRRPQDLRPASLAGGTGTAGAMGMARARLSDIDPESGRWLRRGHQIVLFGV